MLKLHSVNIGGNLHAATGAINRWGWAEYLVHLDSVSGSNTIAIFRMPAQKVWDIRENDPSFIADPHHDDYRGAPDPYSMFASPSDTRPVTHLATEDGEVNGNDPDEQDAADEQLEMHNPGEGEPGYREPVHSGDEPPVAQVAINTTPKEPDEIVVPAKKETKPRKKAAETVDAKPIPVNPDMPVNLENLPEWAR